MPRHHFIFVWEEKDRVTVSAHITSIYSMFSLCSISILQADRQVHWSRDKQTHTGLIWNEECDVLSNVLANFMKPDGLHGLNENVIDCGSYLFV